MQMDLLRNRARQCARVQCRAGLCFRLRDQLEQGDRTVSIPNFKSSNLNV